MYVTVFGGSEPKPGDQAYKDALLLGSLLGSGGHTVMTGGYMGTMEAVSRGVAEAGGHAIGIPAMKLRPGVVISPIAGFKQRSVLRQPESDFLH
jgi:hypothetical protein